MDWLKQALRQWLFPLELAQLQQLQDRNQNLLNLLQSLPDSEVKRLTLADLQLTLEEQMNLKSCDKAFRAALWKSGEHICLTAYPECCRKTAVGMREYQRKLTLSHNNKIPDLDDSSMDRAMERSKKFFTPRDGKSVA